MNNLNSILDYLKVFNNINKRPAYEPRTMAQEPRNMYSQGQLVRNTVDGSRPGYGGDKFLVKVGSPKKLENVIEQEFIEVIGSKNRPETYKKTGVKKTLYKPQIIVKNKVVLTTDFGTKAGAVNAVKDYRKTTPIKNAPPDLDTLDKQKKKKYLANREKSAKIIEREGVERFATGDDIIHKGHAQNINNPDVPIKPRNIIYTPKKINQSMAGQGANISPTDLDFKINATENNIKDIKKSNMSGLKKKIELEKLDTKLMKYVAQSDGYKTVTLSDGQVYGEVFQKSKSMDMFDEFDMTEKKTKKFVNQYFNDKGKLKDKWTKGNVSDVDKANIKKSYVFLENIKNAQDNAAKVLGNFWCNTKQIVKKAGGGRIGFSGSCSVEVKQKNFLRMTNDVATGKVTGEAAEKIAQNAGKVVAKVGSKSALASIFGLGGLGLDIVYEVGSVGTDMAMNNVSFKEAMQNNWITGSFVQGTGQEEYHKGLFAKDSSAEPHGTAIDLIDKIQSAEKNLERIKTNLVRGDYTGEAKIKQIADQEEVIKNLYNDFDKVARKKTTSPGHPEGEQTRYLALEEGSPERIAYDQAKLEYDSGRESKALIKKSSKAGFEQSLESSRAKPWIDFGLSINPQYGKYSKREIDTRLKKYGDYTGSGYTPYGLDYGIIKSGPRTGKYDEDLGYKELSNYIDKYEANQKIADAGGVANMATGGLAGLMKKYYD